MQPLVTAGTVDGGGLLIASGLAAGDRVVTEGQFRLKTGTKVVPMAPGEVAAPKPVPGEARKQGESGKG
jgi:multidrug efflux system membrane fusion protein